MENERPRLNWFRILAVMGLVVLTAAGGFIWSRSITPDLVSNPSTPRSDPYYSEMVSAKASTPAVTINELLEKMQKVDNEGSMKFVFDNVSDLQNNDWGFQHAEVIRVAADQKAPIGRGHVWIDFIGLGYGKLDPSKDKWDQYVDGQFYESDLTPLEEDSSDRISSRQQRFRYDGLFPRLKVGLRKDDGERIRLIGIECFDGRMKTDLCSSTSYHHFSDSSHTSLTEVDLQRWHDGPIEMFYDLAHGDPVIKEIDANEGELIEFGTCSMLLFGKGPRGNRGVNTSSDGQKRTLTLPTGNDDERSTFFFMVLPETQRRPYDVEAFDKDGKKLKTYGSGSSTFMFYQHFDCPPDKVARIRFSYFPEITRVIFEIPSTPGMPAANEGIENLFQVEAPNVVFERDWEMRNFIHHATGLKMNYLPLKVPKGYFPRRYETVTPEEALNELLTLTTTPKRAVISEDGESIQLRDPWQVELKRDAEKFLKKIFK